MKKKLLLVLCLLSVGLASVEAAWGSRKRQYSPPPTGKLDSSGIEGLIQNLKLQINELKSQRARSKDKKVKKQLKKERKLLRKKLKKAKKALKKARKQNK